MQRCLLFVCCVLCAAAAAEGAAIFKYDAHGKRDPFIPLIGIERPARSTLADVTMIEQVKLEGIATISGGKRVAILNGEAVRELDRAGNVIVRKISAASITLSISGVDFILQLPEEGGTKRAK